MSVQEYPGALGRQQQSVWRGQCVPAAPPPLLVAVGNRSNGGLAEDALMFRSTSQ